VVDGDRGPCTEWHAARNQPARERSGDRPRRPMLLATLVLALLAFAVPQTASAGVAASASVSAISMTPSTTQPYYACPNGACDAIVEPPPVKTTAGYALPNGTPLVGSGVEGGYTPEELRSAYGIPKTGGAGQTIAVIDAFGDETAEEDLAIYREKYKLPECARENVNKEHCFKKVNGKGEEGNYPPPPPSGNNWGIETSLDLDMVSAACPECHILLVEAAPEVGGGPETGEIPTLAAAVNKAVELGATEISNSYSSPEDYEPWCGVTGCAQYNSDYDHPEYENSKHERYPIVITASAGDHGYDNDTFGAGVDLPGFPATSPYVISVGGTELDSAANSRGWSETAWFDTGSGCSSFEVRAEWQPVGACGSKRTDNDVAAVASCATPVSVYSTPRFGGWWYMCGTSASAPLIAGIEAHASGYTRSLGAQAFYKKPSMLFHISEGSNGTCGVESESSWYLCNATKAGYNGPTGWGTPDGVFEAATAPTATTAPATGVTGAEATLHGSVTPNGAETTYYFEYGREVGKYTHKTEVVNAGAGGSSIEVSKTLAGLLSNTPYYYRIVATNSNGTTDGLGEAFTTSLGTPPNWVVAAKALSSGESRALAEATTVSTAFLIKATFVSNEVKVECKALKAKGANVKGAETGAGGKGEVEALKFTECEVVGALASKCEVSGKEFTTGAISGQLEEAGGVVKDKLTPKTGETLASVSFANKSGGTCPATVKGTKNLKGSIIANLPQAGTEQAHRKLEFTATSGSKVTLGENTAELTGGTEIELASKEALGTTYAPDWLIAGKELGAGESRTLAETATVSKAFLLKAAFVGNEAKIECKALSEKAANIKGAEAGAAGKGEAEALKFAECEFTGTLASKCEVSGKGFTTVALNGQLEEAGGVVKDKLTPKTGETLASVVLANKGLETCPAAVKGTKNLRGSITANLPQAGVEQAHHKLEFTATSGSKVTLGESTAELTGGAEVELTSKEAFGTD
jgi:hypothetical protein